jgi:hypothetical protein
MDDYVFSAKFITIMLLLSLRERVFTGINKFDFLKRNTFKVFLFFI